MDLGKISFRANSGRDGIAGADKVDMVAYSGDIALGDMGIEGPLLDARDSIGSAAGEVAIVGTSTAGLFLYRRVAPPRWRSAACTGNAATLAMRVVEVYDKPVVERRRDGAASCAIKGGLSAVDDRRVALRRWQLLAHRRQWRCFRRGHGVSGDVTVERRSSNQVEATVGSTGRTMSRSGWRTRR